MTGPWHWHAQGDADEYCLLMDDRRWVIAFRLNGEMTIEQHMPILSMIAAAPEMLEALHLCVIRDPSLKANAMVMNAIAKAEGTAEP